MEHRHLRAVWMFFALAVVLFIVAPLVIGAPRLIAAGDEVTIVLYDDPCWLSEKVTNLPMRATWTDKGAAPVEGCWNLNNEGIVMFYFADRTVVAVAKKYFSPIGKT